MDETRKKIAVIDDDPFIIELLELNLSAEGYEVITATDGEAAMDIIENEKPDLIILDVMMPRMDGWEVCRMVKENPDLSEIRVLMLTARDTMKDRMIGQEILKADEYMTKPFDIHKLSDRVRKILHEKGREEN